MGIKVEVHRTMFLFCIVRYRAMFGETSPPRPGARCTHPHKIKHRLFTAENIDDAAYNIFLAMREG